MTKPERAHRHHVLVAALLVAAVVCGLFAMFAVWANRQALNTKHWTDTSGDLLADHHVQNAVGGYLVDQLFSSVDVSGEIQQLLPSQAAALAGPASAGVRELASRTAPQLLARPRVQALWRNANEAAHKQLLRVINGGGSTVSTDNGDVVLNLHSLVDQLAATLGVSPEKVNAARSKLQSSQGQAARGAAEQKLGVTLPPSSGELVIMHSDQLAFYQDVAKAIKGLAVVLTALTLLLFALAVWLADGWRRLAFRRVGWCFIGLGVLVLLARRVIGNRVVDGLVANPSVKPAGHSVWTIGTSLLYDIAIAMFAYGVLIVVAAWLGGSTRSATAVRRALAPSLRYRLGTSYAVLGGVFALVLLWGPTAATRKPLGILLFAGLLVLGMELLRRNVAVEFPDARPGETKERMRASWQRRRGRRAGAESVGELERLAALHDRGVLSDGEFDAQKVRIINGS
jgi:hypothetical protein